MRLAPLAMLLALGACDSMDGDDGSGGKADELDGLDIAVTPGAVKDLVLDATGLADADISPAVSASKDSDDIDIETDDLRLALPDSGLTASIAPAVSSGVWASYAFRLEYAPSGTEQWTPVIPDSPSIPASSPWNWDSVELLSQDAMSETMHLVGYGVSALDAVGDLAVAELERIEATIPNGSDLRFLVIPIWNFWDSDASRYVATLFLY
jgi:hypothetical protein